MWSHLHSLVELLMHCAHTSDAACREAPTKWSMSELHLHLFPVWPTEKILWYKINKNKYQNIQLPLKTENEVWWCILVCLLGHVTHLGSDIAQQEESNSGDATDDLCYPEGRFPAVVLGNCTEWKPRKEATNWGKNTWINYPLQGLYTISLHYSMPVCVIHVEQGSCEVSFNP